ncbi:Prefoldin subunit-domain-containing protein [Morchella snyderi]|nr:Prefoldin subunit-domain-containing protein [Morchella snyderi]
MDRRMLSREDEAQTDTVVTREDQNNINKFSTLHQKQGILREELENKNQEKEYVDDVTSELELADEDDMIPYKIGDSFLHLPLEDVQQLLEKSAQDITKEIEALEEKIERNDETMGELKVKLYAKFGKAINLEV